MSTVDFSLACRMIKACATAYYIGKTGGVTKSPYYNDIGFEAEPWVFDGGTDDIDACMVGTNADGVIVTFRGTLPPTLASVDAFFQSLLDWLNDAKIAQVPVDGIPGKVHKGFSEALSIFWEPMLPELQRQLQSGKPLIVTGHSKGAAVATLAAIKLLNQAQLTPLAVFPFASPRTGDHAFVTAYNTQLPQTWRFANRDDIVPHLPPSDKVLDILESLPNSIFKLLSFIPPYEHVKTLEFINWEGTIEGDSTWLEIQRLEHLAVMLAELKIEEILEEHASSGGYMVDTCRAAGSSAKTEAKTKTKSKTKA